MLRFRPRLVKRVFLTAFFVLAGYYIYRGVENYVYLHDHFFNTNFKDTRKKVLSGRLVLQNTTCLQLDTVDLLQENLILNYSATWCRPCLEELPLLTELHRNQSVHHYRLYFILEEENKTINEFLMKQKLPFPAYRLVSMPSGALTHSIYPVTFICKAGQIEVNIKGKLAKEDIDMIYRTFTE